MHHNSKSISRRSALEEQQRYFPRKLNEDLLREDLIKNHIKPPPEFLVGAEAGLE